MVLHDGDQVINHVIINWQGIDLSVHLCIGMHDLMNIVFVLTSLQCNLLLRGLLLVIERPS